MPTNNSCNYVPVQHDVLVGGASGSITSVSPSTAGFLLTSNGISADPSFQSASAGTYYSLTPYVVGGDANSQFTTIQLAITQATSDGASNAAPKNIYVKPGTYAGNFTMVPGINVIGIDEGSYSGTVVESVKITGNITVNGSSNCILQNLHIAPSAGNIITISATGSAVSVTNCYLDSASTFFAALSNSADFYLQRCAVNAKLFTLSGNSKNYSFNCYDCYFSEQGSTFLSTTGNVVSLVISHSDIVSLNIASGSATTETIDLQLAHCNISYSSPFGTSSATGTVTCSLYNCRNAQSGAVYTMGSASQTVVMYNTTYQGSSVPTAGTGHVVGNFVTDTAENSYVGKNVVLTSTYLGTGPMITSGAGDPNGAVTALKGSLYLNTTGSGVSDRGFINSDGGTTWKAITTVV